MPAIVWADGKRVSGETWESIERSMRLDDWRSEGRLTPVKYRKELCQRAYVYADLDALPDHRGSSEEFLTRMAGHGLLEIIAGGEHAALSMIGKGRNCATVADYVDAVVESCRTQSHSVRIG